ncbi:Vegetative incompatibility protein [Paramyrothecium foliicola]|nr:Vegetative incompatibility protein [Paramyrothecium foliicola]
MTEAINSMYKRYRNAEVCYAYLGDVSTNEALMGTEFARSNWFTRRWTLQELIAPPNVVFLNHQWLIIGTKRSLKAVISDITKIDVAMLDKAYPEEFSIGRRMAWASHRTTIKLEDMAYSLLWLFGLNMPLLYGKGDTAIIRLQEEIMKKSDDPYIFVWKNKSNDPSGLLAKSPSDFDA